MHTPEVLREQAGKFIQALVSDGSLRPESYVRCQVRPPSIAHRYSTAYHIVAGQVPLDRLIHYPTDLDGNIWFRPEWLLLARLEADGDAYLNAVIQCNAASNCRETWSAEWHEFVGRTATLRWPVLGYALEGYPADSPQRRPNVETIPMSKHVSGMAVDIALHLDSLPDFWDPHIDAVAQEFGLHRPYPQSCKHPEYWHFEFLDA